MAMLRNSIGSVRKTVGQELMRIEGVYMYMITDECNVGAFQGHKCLRICTWECPRDENPMRAYLVCNKWVYPLARSFSPVHINESNTLVMPDPFSKFEHPNFIAIKLPYTMTYEQKLKLENYLDVFGHLYGHFTRQKDILPDSKLDFPVYDSDMCRRTWSLIRLTMEDVDDLEDKWYLKNPKVWAAFSTNNYRLFDKRNLNLIRCYVAGPKDVNHIHISTAPAGIKINQLLYVAIGLVYKRQKLWRKFHEYRGQVPNFDQRLLGHEDYLRKYHNIYNHSIDPADNVIKAGKVFDLRIKYLDFFLLDYELREEALPSMFHNLELEGALITRKVYTQREPIRFEFAKMQTLSQIDIDRETRTICVPRVAEHCDHHKPTEILLRPVKNKLFGTRTY